jgi:hypothetical protein
VDTAVSSEQAGDHHQLAPPPAELAVLQADFPCFRIWREQTCDRARYEARSLHLELNPHTIVTDDIRELRATLESSRHAACPRPHPAGQAPPARPLQSAAS